MREKITRFDASVISAARRLAVPLARISLFVIYFWFGILKLIGTSPANALVMQLQQRTLPFLSFGTFYTLFALFEMLIGILFLVPKLTRPAAALFFLHMITTLMPLLLLPEVAWQSVLVPTLEGQYIIKNLALISLVALLVSSLQPRQQTAQ